MLTVSQGKVRGKRLSDNSTVVVHAEQAAIAAAGREMSPVTVPDSVSRWKSQWHRPTRCSWASISSGQPPLVSGDDTCGGGSQRQLHAASNDQEVNRFGYEQE